MIEPMSARQQEPESYIHRLLREDEASLLPFRYPYSPLRLAERDIRWSVDVS